MMKKYTTQVWLGIILIFGLSCLLSYLWTSEPNNNAFTLRAPFIFYKQFQVDEDFINRSLDGDNLLWNIILITFATAIFSVIWNEWREREQKLSDHLIDDEA